MTSANCVFVPLHCQCTYVLTPPPPPQGVHSSVCVHGRREVGLKGTTSGTNNINDPGPIGHVQSAPEGCFNTLPGSVEPGLRSWNCVLTRRSLPSAQRVYSLWSAPYGSPSDFVVGKWLNIPSVDGSQIHICCSAIFLDIHIMQFIIHWGLLSTRFRLYKK